MIHSIYDSVSLGQPDISDSSGQIGWREFCDDLKGALTGLSGLHHADEALKAIQDLQFDARELTHLSAHLCVKQSTYLSRDYVEILRKYLAQMLQRKQITSEELKYGAELLNSLNRWLRSYVTHHDETISLLKDDLSDAERRGLTLLCRRFVAECRQAIKTQVLNYVLLIIESRRMTLAEAWMVVKACTECAPGPEDMGAGVLIDWAIHPIAIGRPQMDLLRRAKARLQLADILLPEISLEAAEQIRLGLDADSVLEQ